MTGEKENRKYYQETFKEVHASQELLRKVEAMGMEHQKKNGTKILRRSCIAVAALAIGLISSNIISYAATGRAWIITITTSDGKDLPTAPGTYELEDGTEYTVKYELEETKASVTVEEEADSTKAEGAKTEGIEVEISTENSVDLLEQPQEGNEGKLIRNLSSDSYMLEMPQE